MLKDLLSRLYGFLNDTNDPILNGPIPSPHYYQALRILRGEEQLPPRVQLTPPYQGWWSSLTKSEWDTLMNLIYSQGKESKNKQQ
ncbi:hypothetical protein [Caldivirga sp.]|uniref:hypothetical protein n=1 Tax=Caldivirga sp. TaxID=2080243 RepID=UPI003D0B847B